MLSKFGVIAVLTAGLVVSVVASTLNATPLVVAELTKVYPPKTPVPALYRTDEQICSQINENTPGSCIPNADLGDGLGKYKVYKTTSTVAVRDVTIDFPAWMSEEDIARTMQKNLSAGTKYEIWHAAPNGAKRN